MHSGKKAILSWVMLLCAVFATGCKGGSGEEDALVCVEQADMPEDIKESPAAEDAEKDAKASSVDEGGIIYVDVRGQINNPGVYELTSESRVYEAIEKAGGLMQTAAEAAVNQAERLTDGQQIYIPSEEEWQKAGADKSLTVSGAAKTGNINGSNSDGKVNLNTASKEEIMTLSGIGEVKADSIIRYREEHGGFQSVEDIKKIEGIKDGVFNKIKNQITI